MATSCDQHSQNILWTRLAATIPRRGYTAAALQLFPTPPPSILLHHHHHHQQWPRSPIAAERLSAFQPVFRFKSEETPTSTLPTAAAAAAAARSSSSPTTHPHTPFLANVPSPRPYHHQHRSNLDHQTASEAAAHLETIVSNMGTSKQGHLCIYCGKLYSRKYGLKIHIRTHTGFKPLKCKYCFRPFGDPSNLNKHVRLHVQGSTIYKCPECEKILVRRRDLERHIQSRHRNANASENDESISSSVEVHSHSEEDAEEEGSGCNAQPDANR